MSEFPRIYILTRTSGRKNFFHQNFLSIYNQTYQKITHLVSYDDSETAKYVLPYTTEEDTGENDYQFRAFEMRRIARQGNGHFPYNLYLNQLMNQIEEPGWIMFLDDDDLLVDSRSIEVIVNRIINNRLTGDHHLLLWQVLFPKNRLVPRRTGGTRVPRIGDVSMIGFMFHSSWKEDVRFEDRKGGDHQFIRALWSRFDLTPIWISQILTKVNYQNIRRIGSGQRNDLKFSAVQKEEYKLFWENKMAKRNLSLKKKPKVSLVRKNDTNEDKNNSLVLDDDSISFDRSFESSLDQNVLKNINLDQDLNQLLEQDQLDSQIKSVIDHGSASDEEKDNQPKKKRIMIAPKLKVTPRKQIASKKKVVINNVTRTIPPADDEDEDNENDNEDNDNGDNDNKNDDEENEDEENDENKEEEDNDDEENEDEENEDEENKDGENEDEDKEDEDEVVIHPQIEKLLDLLSNDKQVKVVTINDLQEEIKSCVKEALREALLDLRNNGGDNLITDNKGSPAIKSKSVVVPKKSNTTPAVKAPPKRTVIPRKRMNIRERRALRLKQLKEQKKEKRAARLALKARQQQSRQTAINNQLNKGSSIIDQSESIGNQLNTKSLQSQLSDLLSNDDTSMGLTSGSLNLDLGSLGQEGGGEEEHTLSSLLSNYAEESVEGGGADLDSFDSYIDKVFIMNFEGRADDLQHKLEGFGFTDVQVIEPNKRKDFWMNMFELLRAANKRGYQRVMIFKDHIHLHKNFITELMYHFPKIKSRNDWKMIALGASQNLCTKAGIDAKFYLEQYPDLGRSKINDEAGAQKHWKLHGMRERRFGQRSLSHPDTLAGLCGVICSSKIYNDLSKLQKSRNPREFMVKNYKTSTYATSPLLALTGLTRMVKMRNRHNLEFYEMPSKY